MSNPNETSLSKLYDEFAREDHNHRLDKLNNALNEAFRSISAGLINDLVSNKNPLLSQTYLGNAVKPAKSE